MKVYGRCHKCKKTNLQVRLYRPYGNFYRTDDNCCNEHISEGCHDVYVPLILGVDGEVWGYTTYRPNEWATFFMLPEANTTTLSWSPDRTKPGESHWKPQTEYSVDVATT